MVHFIRVGSVHIARKHKARFIHVRWPPNPNILLKAISVIDIVVVIIIIKVGIVIIVIAVVIRVTIRAIIRVVIVIEIVIIEFITVVVVMKILLQGVCVSQSNGKESLGGKRRANIHTLRHANFPNL